MRPEDVELARNVLEWKQALEKVGARINGDEAVLFRLAEALVAANPPEPAYVVRLDGYERDNLLALLHLIYCFGGSDGPTCLATGDWLGQLYWKLAPEGYSDHRHCANLSPEDQLAMLKRWALALIEAE